MDEPCDFSSKCIESFRSIGCENGVCDCLKEHGYRRSETHPDKCIDSNSKDRWYGDPCSSHEDCGDLSKIGAASDILINLLFN